MPKGILFWVLMILWAIFGFWTGYSHWEWGPVGSTLLLFVLLALLGWQVFGRPIQ